MQLFSECVTDLFGCYASCNCVISAKLFHPLYVVLVQGISPDPIPHVVHCCDVLMTQVRHARRGVDARTRHASEAAHVVRVLPAHTALRAGDARVLPALQPAAGRAGTDEGRRRRTPGGSRGRGREGGRAQVQQGGYSPQPLGCLVSVGWRG